MLTVVDLGFETEINNKVTVKVGLNHNNNVAKIRFAPATIRGTF